MGTVKLEMSTLDALRVRGALEYVCRAPYNDHPFTADDLMHLRQVTNRLGTPDCHICGCTLDVCNDTDAETGGFWSAHARCRGQDLNGRYVVLRIGEEPTDQNVDGVWGFRYLKRAVDEVHYLNRANTPYNGRQFYVWDREDRMKVIPEFCFALEGADA